MELGSLAGLSAVTLPPAAAPTAPRALDAPGAAAPSGELQQAFDSFVGETFYGQMLQALRKTQGQAAYFNGGRAEEVFRNQLDQTLAQELSQSTAGQFTGPMFELFSLQRRA